MPQSDENEVRLPAPLDGVSAVRFDGSGEHLLVSSWDASLRLYDVQSATLRRSWTQPAPLLDAEFDGDGRAVSAGLDYAVRLHELERDTQRQLGQHDSAVRCVRWSVRTSHARCVSDFGAQRLLGSHHQALGLARGDGVRGHVCAARQGVQSVRGSTSRRRRRHDAATRPGRDCRETPQRARPALQRGAHAAA
jgi:hypothetical protein